VDILDQILPPFIIPPHLNVSHSLVSSTLYKLTMLEPEDGLPLRVLNVSGAFARLFF
jgi:hypothetical protein